MKGAKTVSTGFEDRFAVERKSLVDLVHTIIHERARFERELERMRTFAFRRVICTASMEAVRRGQYPHSMCYALAGQFGIGTGGFIPPVRRKRKARVVYKG